MGLNTIMCLLVVVGGVLSQRRPPNYSLDEMPDIQTSFSCHDKIVGGYYSDPETDCQMFHVCVRIAGVGVQDFRFLCPNDTAFDQENQICDDWYNIDCEASTLYYSDNFDLFRLGPDDIGFSQVKPTPIPLGPSSAPRIAPHPKPRRPHAPVNNAVSEADDDLYLQRGDAGDRGVSQDLLRGSSSGNFFNNRNGGKEDPDDDYVAPSSARQQELVKSPKKKTNNNKNQVRKLLTGKRPVAQSTTAAPTTASPTAPSTANYNRYNTVQRNRPTVTPSTENYPSTTVFNNQPQGFNSNPQNFNSQRFRPNQNFAFNKKPATTTEFVQETTAAPAYNNFQRGGNNYFQKTVSTVAPAFNNYYQTTAAQGNNFYQTTQAPANNYKTNYNQANNYYQTSTTTAAPTNYKSNYNQGNNYYQTPTTTAAPQYNYNQQTSTPASTAYNAYQNRGSQQPTTNYNQQNTNYQNTNYQTNNYQNSNYQPTKNTFSAYNSPSTVNANINYEATTLKQNYFQKQTTVNYDNYYKTSTSAPVVYSTEAPNYNYDSSANVFQQTKNQYNYNVNAAGTTTVNYNPYNSYKSSNDAYDEPSQGESLKTAPSSNIKPSDLNAIAKSYQKPVGGFNASLTAAYNFVNPSTTLKPTSKFYNSAKQFQTTVKPYQQTQTQAPTTFGRGNAFYAQSTTASPQPRPFSKAPEGTVAPPKPKEKDASYDYAYYDEGTGSEYDGIDTIGEEFSRTTYKQGRTTPQ